jgi:hypothetical protein
MQVRIIHNQRGGLVGGCSVDHALPHVALDGPHRHIGEWVRESKPVVTVIVPRGAKVNPKHAARAKQPFSSPRMRGQFQSSAQAASLGCVK